MIGEGEQLQDTSSPSKLDQAKEAVLEDAEWSAIEIDSLTAAIGDGLSIQEVAEVLERKIDDVVRKCDELGLQATGV
jgi:hypothetical protein